MIASQHPDLIRNDYSHELLANLARSNPSVFKKIRSDPTRSVLKDGISFKGGAGKALVDIVKYADDDGTVFTQNVYQDFSQQQAATPAPAPKPKPKPEPSKMPAQVKQDSYQSPYANQISDLLKSIKSQQSAIQGIKSSTADQATSFQNMLKQQGASFSEALASAQAQSSSALQQLRQTMGSQADKTASSMAALNAALAAQGQQQSAAMAEQAAILQKTFEQGLAVQAKALADKEAADKFAAIKAAEAQKVSMANAAMGGSAPNLKIGQPAPTLTAGIKGFVRRAPLTSANISNFMGINL
jgi:hypothetical protein|tara:strand:+ start:181 stop:1080 length:900 start_codon:yes stop_codon:yes gene_type:complete